MITGISTLLVVHDLKISKDFYINILGFEFISEHENCVRLKVGDHQVSIFKGNTIALNYQHGYESNSTLVMTINNLDEKIKQLKRKGIEFVHQAPNENQWGRYTAFKNPSGIVHEIFESKV